jgi:hypothetical protein
MTPSAPILSSQNITDEYTRKNFDNLISYFKAQNQLLGFNFFDQTFTKATLNFLLAHGCTTAPQDVIVTKVTGPGLVTFNHGLFDATNINITVTDACRIRFFIGTYWAQNTPPGPQKSDTSSYVSGA